MKRRGILLGSLLVSLNAPLFVASAGAATSTVITAHATFPTSLVAGVPLARLHFDHAVAAGALPSAISTPVLRAQWQQIGPNDVRLVSSSSLVPTVKYQLIVPRTLRCATRCTTTSQTVTVVTAAGSTTWLQQLLATDGYLPVSFQRLSASSIAGQPSPGTFTWKYPTLATTLRPMWRVGVSTVLVRGAIMRFQDQHHLAVSGVANSSTWYALIHEAQRAITNPRPYNFVLVTMGSPETLTLYVGGRATFHTTVNTGIPQSPTATGTYPVYLRFTSTTMSGTNPDGSTYHDTGIPWVSYFNGGDALHGFIRSTYGWPQSLGCVEMRFDDAKAIWPSTPIGTLVTVR